MKYKIGDKVKYYNRGKIGIGTITVIHELKPLTPYGIEGTYYYESKQKAIFNDGHYYIIKKRVDNVPDFIKNLFN